MTWPGCPARDPWELRLQRAALAVLVMAGFSAQRPFTAQPFPVGIARYIDFSFFANEAVRPWLTVGLVLSLTLYVLGQALPLAIGVMLSLWVGAGALANSQGALSHYTQLVALVLLGQLVAYVQWCWMKRRGMTPTTSGVVNAHDLAVYYTLQVMAAAYILSGLMKIVLSEGQWLARVPFIASDVLKTHGQVYASTLRAGVIARGDANAAFILTHPNLMRTLLASGALIELTAWVALLGRRSAFVVGVGLLAMHAAIDYLMLIGFAENQGLLLIYFVNVPFLVIAAARRIP